MRDDVTQIIDDFLKVCKVVHPDFENNGAIMTVYQQDSFEDLFQAIVDLNHTLVFFHIPTKYLNIVIEYPVVNIKLDYKALEILCHFYCEDEGARKQWLN